MIVCYLRHDLNNCKRNFSTPSLSKEELFSILDEPAAPEKPIVAEVTRKSMHVVWNEPDDGGSTITGYHLERKDTLTNRWTRVVRDLIRSTDYKVSLYCLINASRLFR